MPKLDCGENLKPGIPQFGVGCAATKKEARNLAMTMAQAGMAAVGNAQAAQWQCPPECKNGNVEGLVHTNVTGVASARIAPAFW
ncbi:MAG: hypothetical protein KGM42_10020 [Hyphomicrobiales bacterium]|nr:hypothetical protein [Hyphomicrobiales bacterium]